jgi:hypothetical protein
MAIPTQGMGTYISGPDHLRSLACAFTAHFRASRAGAAARDATGDAKDAAAAHCCNQDGAFGKCNTQVAELEAWDTMAGARPNAGQPPLPAAASTGALVALAAAAAAGAGRGCRTPDQPSSLEGSAFDDVELGAGRPRCCGGCGAPVSAARTAAGGGGGLARAAARSLHWLSSLVGSGKSARAGGCEGEAGAGAGAAWQRRLPRAGARGGARGGVEGEGGEGEVPALRASWMTQFRWEQGG